MRSGLMAREFAFLWPRRKALAEGGGRGCTFSSATGGEGAFLGGVKERVFSWGGGEMLKLGVDVLLLLYIWVCAFWGGDTVCWYCCWTLESTT